jgi:hypothetical protein
LDERRATNLGERNRVFSPHRITLVVASACVAFGGGREPLLAIPSDQQQQVAEVRRLGGTVFERDGSVVEVNLNRTKVKDQDLDHLSGFTAMTDLSLEETAIGDDGLRRLSGLKALVWLNLYRTRVGDDGLANLEGLTRLEHLPLGETRVTDAGLVHLVGLRRLTYLGLRGDRITDAGLRHAGEADEPDGPPSRPVGHQRSGPGRTEAPGPAQEALAE